METLRLVDPELVPLLDSLPTVQMNAASLPLIRKGLESAVNAMLSVGDGLPVEVEEHIIPGDGQSHDLRLLVVRPASAKQGRVGVLHIHGGGYVIGSPEQFLPMLRRTAMELDGVIASVDYRLSPETVYPGPLDDCTRAFEWFAGAALSLGVDPARIGLMGDSAGGGLAAAVGLKARGVQGPRIAFLSLMYPMLDDRTAAERAPGSVTGEFVWTPQSNHFGWSCMLGEVPGSNSISEYAAPARAEDLSGMPPTFIGVGTLDLFLDEDIDFALRLAHAGVQVELQVYPGAFHGFVEAVDAGVSGRANLARLDAIRRLFAA